jgi:hypothetical protein
MEIAAFFLLVILLGVLVVLGGGVYAIAAHFRRQKLHPEEDKLAGKLEGDVGEQDGRKPEHVRTEPPQQAHFVGTPKRS